MTAVGQFVRVTSNRLGVGKVVSAAEGEIEVEYFDSVAATRRERVIAPPGELERVQISLQRRCYWLDGDEWRVGRVVCRVLEDPRPRYLLADEVGLGKTVEAGLIMRQCLLDHPDGHVVVIAPPMLRRQWVSELREKFMVDDFERAVISVLGYDHPSGGRAADATTSVTTGPTPRPGF